MARLVEADDDDLLAAASQPPAPADEPAGSPSEPSDGPEGVDVPEEPFEAAGDPPEGPDDTPGEPAAPVEHPRVFTRTYQVSGGEVSTGVHHSLLATIVRDAVAEGYSVKG